METKISVKDLMMQAFLTGWELSDKSISQDEYLQSSIDVIEVLQVEHTFPRIVRSRLVISST